jgi:hypothetical protein
MEKAWLVGVDIGGTKMLAAQSAGSGALGGARSR